MKLARVIGNVWATRKDPSLTGKRMLLIQPLSFDGANNGTPIISLDIADAGKGDTVIYTTATEATVPFRPGLTATDATIVGIVDIIDHESRVWKAYPE